MPRKSSPGRRFTSACNVIVGGGLVRERKRISIKVGEGGMGEGGGRERINIILKDLWFDR